MHGVDRRILQESNLPSDDSGSEGEENLLSRTRKLTNSLRTREQHIGEVTVHWPSFCKVHTSIQCFYSNSVLR